MCGIFGFLGPIDYNKGKMCTDRLEHRGPDGAGYYHKDGLFLGHRRLSILDLSEAGSQPMAYANERYWIVFNGEIYNFIEIRDELKTKGHIFKSDSDTEVILAAYLEWGDTCLDKMNGMWAFAIWDKQTRELFFSRDRFGKKSLFYIQTAEGFGFASEMKALLPFLEEIKPVDYLVREPKYWFQYETTEECIIQGINRFPAGSCGILKDGKLTIKKWWKTLDHISEVPKTYEEQVERFRELFFDACKIRMRSDVTIGTALSGGVDSSSVLCAMHQIAQNNHDTRVSDDWQHAVVASFPGTPLDETADAQLVANSIGTTCTPVVINPNEAINDLDRYFWLFEELYNTSPIPFMQTYGKIKAEGITVSIDGHGADEMFGGYPFDVITAIDDAMPNMKQAKTVVETMAECFPKDSKQLNRNKYMMRTLGGHYIKKVRNFPHSGRKYKEMGWLNNRLYESTHETILPVLLRNYDRYAMANGVEIRMPFMDHRLATFAFSLSWEAKIRNGYTKCIVRDAMAPYVPNEIIYRKKKIGFNSPITDWMRGPMKTYFLDLINSQDFKNCSLMDVSVATERVKGVIEGSEGMFNQGEKAWGSIVPYFWERAFVKHG